jgi:16S rRNA (guanine527-N7)-methyltransferase
VRLKMLSKKQMSLLDEWDVSRETVSKLKIYHELLLKWNKKINLIAPSTACDIWQRHFFDSLQCLPLLDGKESKIVDLGSGAGFPALPLSASGFSNITLIESDERKGHFLKMVIRELSLSANIITDRIENIEPLRANMITARACASLDALLSYAKPHLNKGGKCIFLKGKNAQEEIKLARQNHQFDAIIHKSFTDPEGCILEIQNLS